MTMTSLFAKATRLPHSKARKVGSSPAVPMVAAITKSTSSRVDISSIGAHWA